MSKRSRRRALAVEPQAKLQKSALAQKAREEPKTRRPTTLPTFPRVLLQDSRKPLDRAGILILGIGTALLAAFCVWVFVLGARL